MITPSASTPPSPQIARLRNALRVAQSLHADEKAEDKSPQRRRELQAASRAVDEAAAPLLAQFTPALLPMCRRLAQSSRSPEPLDADDLAQEAWLGTLRYLSDAVTGEKINDEEHFGRFLRKRAYHLFLNKQNQQNALLLLDAPSEGGGDTRGEQLAGPRFWPDVLHEAEQSQWADFIHALFQNDDGVFRAACRVPPRRRAVVYRAFVLISIAGFLRVLQVNTGARGAFGGSLLHELARRLNLPPPDWEIIERAVLSVPPLHNDELSGKTQDAGINDAIIQAICAACDVSVMSRTQFHVLRHDVRKLAIGNHPTAPTK